MTRDDAGRLTLLGQEEEARDLERAVATRADLEQEGWRLDLAVPEAVGPDVGHAGADQGKAES
jgi:hypothetical protein